MKFRSICKGFGSFSKSDCFKNGTARRILWKFRIGHNNFSRGLTGNTAPVIRSKRETLRNEVLWCYRQHCDTGKLLVVIGRTREPCGAVLPVSIGSTRRSVTRLTSNRAKGIFNIEPNKSTGPIQFLVPACPQKYMFTKK